MKSIRWFVTLFAVSVMIFVIGVSPSKAEQKIGFFDLEKVLSTSQWGKSVQEKLKKEEGQIRSQLQTKQEELSKMRDEVQTKQGSGKAADEAKKQKMKEFEQKRQEAEHFLFESNKKLQNLSEQLMKPLIDKIMEIVKDIAKKEKYDLVLEARRSGMIYGDDKYDLTQKIIQELDKQPQTVAPAPTSAPTGQKK
ncbi:MAG: OmpH family outer membrane protein [Syntrophobacterales bacterium]|nr:OmpH family outer membrane protein [Syntrophobacterales bacterium]